MRAIMVMFDSLNRRFLEPYGCDFTKTPNFKRLAEKTACFDNFYVGSLPCMPARRFKPYAKFSVYVSSYTRRYTTYSNDALDAIYKECTKEENRLVDTKVAALTLQGEEEMYKDMTCVPVYAAINNTLYQEYIDLPMESYNAQTGWGWQYSTKK